MRAIEKTGGIDRVSRLALCNCEAGTERREGRWVVLIADDVEAEKIDGCVVWAIASRHLCDNTKQGYAREMAVAAALLDTSWQVEASK